MTKSILTKSLLLGGVVLAAAACSNEKLSDINPDKTLENPKINITLKTPSPEGIVVKGSVEDETDERTINYLNVYIFEEGSSTNENNYTLYSTTKFTTDGSDGSIAFTQGTDANSTTTCSLDIPAGLIGKKVRVGVIANDTPTVEINKTTLATFRTVLATATLTDEDESTEGTQVSADALVGGDTKSFPMSAITDATAALTPYGLDLSVELVRTVSRIDICNYAPDLIITSVQITNANESSYLNSGSGTVNEPGSLTRSLIINPLKKYQTELQKSNTVNGASIVGIVYDDSKDKDGTAEEIKKLNTKRALYLYEQSSSSTTSPKVTIGYKVYDGTTEKTGEVTVSFYDGADYVPAKRNYLYTIQLGDGSTVSQGEVKATFKVAEWTEGETIDSDLVLTNNED